MNHISEKYINHNLICVFFMSFYTEDRILFYKNCPFSLDHFLVGLGEVGGGEYMNENRVNGR